MATNKLPVPRQLALSFSKQWEDFGNTSSPAACANLYELYSANDVELPIKPKDSNKSRSIFFID